MNQQPKLTRRRFIAFTIMGVSGICLLSQCGYSQLSRWKVLTEQESILLDALVEQIIPTDEWPGGRDAGVTNFIDQQLDGPYSRYIEDYKKGLTAIQESSKAMFQKRFEELSWDEQTRFLHSMEGGKMEGIVWKDGFDWKFFQLIRNHTMQGYYGSPRHGGNKNNISYKMMKLDYPVIIGQNRYNL